VFGRASTTSPSISIFSSFGKAPVILVLPAEITEPPNAAESSWEHQTADARTARGYSLRTFTAFGPFSPASSS